MTNLIKLMNFRNFPRLLKTLATSFLGMLKVPTRKSEICDKACDSYKNSCVPLMPFSARRASNVCKKSRFSPLPTSFCTFQMMNTSCKDLYWFSLLECH